MLILQFILAFGVMLFLHEFGHFIVSKAFGIEVEEFGFGLPPRICRLFTWKGTEFTLNLLPFGAFVKPKGEFEDPSQNSLRSAPAWKQIFVLLAGPAMNFLTAVVIFTICVHQIGAPDPSIVVLDKVEPDSPAETAGLRPGDQILSIGETDIEHYDMVSEAVKKILDTPAPIRVKRNRNQAISSTATVIPIFSASMSSARISLLAGTAVSVVKKAHTPRNRYIVQMVTMKLCSLNFTWKNPLIAPMAAPVRIPPRIASGMLVKDSALMTMEATPSVDPSVKSMEPRVMMKNTPVATIVG